MKKVIVAAAGLMLAGAMTSTAFADAGVSFSGDARARVKYFNEYTSSSSEDLFFESRARLAFVGESKGGAYVKARFKLANGKWDGTNQTKGTHSRNISVDYAYLGVPLGAVTVEAGLYDDRGITPFTIFADDVDTLQFIYQADSTKLTAFMDMVHENTLNAGVGENVTAWGLVLDQGFSCGANLTAGIRYQYNPNSGGPEGLIAGLDVTGQVGGMTLSGGLGYKDEDFTATTDDGFGLWARLDAPVGAATLSVIAGGTFDGYTPDWGEFDAFYVTTDYTMIADGYMIGEAGDAFWGVLRGTYQASEKLELAAQIAYAKEDDGRDEDIFEIGARASYKILDGASLSAMVGYADYDEADRSPLGMALSLDVKF